MLSMVHRTGIAHEPVLPHMRPFVVGRWRKPVEPTQGIQRAMFLSAKRCSAATGTGLSEERMRQRYNRAVRSRRGVIDVQRGHESPEECTDFCALHGADLSAVPVLQRARDIHQQYSSGRGPAVTWSRVETEVWEAQTPQTRPSQDPGSAAARMEQRSAERASSLHVSL